MIKKSIVFLILAYYAISASDSLSVEWLFENAFEHEFVRINEAITVVPEELEDAYGFYKNGSYRRAADILFQVRRLHLPDGNLDFIAFLLGECYRKLGLMSRAMEEYHMIAQRFPSSDKRVPALYRILEYVVHNGDIEMADSIRGVFEKNWSDHALFNSVLYLCAKCYFEQEFYDETVKLIDQIASSSVRYAQAMFLSSLCYVQAQEWKKALLLLETVIKKAKDINLRSEAYIVSGDIHYKNNRVEKAIEAYRHIPKKASRYEYTRVKIARSMLDLGKFEKAAALAELFIKTQADNEYFFEMASILEQAYISMRMDAKAAAVSAIIQRQIVSTRIMYELYDEIDRLTGIVEQFSQKEDAARLDRDSSNISRFHHFGTRAKHLKKNVQQILDKLNTTGAEMVAPDAVPHLAERRYLTYLKNNMQRIEDSITVLKAMLNRKIKGTENIGRDSLVAEAVDTIRLAISEYEQRYREVGHEHDLIITECLGGDAEEQRLSEEMQIKFIDWEFIKYIEKKDKLLEMVKAHAEEKRKEKADSTVSTDSTMGKADTITYSEGKRKLEKTIISERERLINHIVTTLDIFPKSRYAPAALFRLAELYNDRASEEYRQKMIRYETLLIESKDSAQLVFPEYDLNRVISVYERLYDEFPHDRHADNALYYTALALKKQGMVDSAQKVLLELIEKYPQSEFYVEANMNIGQHFFEYAKKYKNGYKRAEEAFRRVLYYRNHPQFVQALYHLGWCYYMQDRYEEAIAAFRYMIEQVDLEFDPFAKEEKDIANPLLRSEAIDYLAISFDQNRDMNEAFTFFDLIGSDDYAALVLNRMGELCEEDLDFAGAVSIYRMLLDKYPQSLSAPEAALRLMKLQKSNDTIAVAEADGDFFITNFGPGSKWQKRVIERDSSLVVRTDSMVIAIAQGVADDAYREAEKSGSIAMYSKAAKQYKRIVEKYSDHPAAADAAWNYAALLNDKLNDKPTAYERFIEFSRYPDIDSTKRESAALNAIAIAQSLLVTDSITRKGKIDFAGKKLEKAVQNYTTLFAKGDATAKVRFALAGVYFNRNLFSKAADVYKQIIKSNVSEEQRIKAMLLLGQCLFGNEKWREAADIFEDVRKGDVSEEIHDKAYALLLQALFLDAKTMLTKRKYEDAADAFRKIDSRFPGCEYGDVALFNAAEANEKMEKLPKACDCYFDLVKGYPDSKLAPEALFNAAGNYEQIEKFNKAAEAYELLVEKYPDHEKAKDGLFNLGFCYEKLGKLDKMTYVNERYSMLYPEEKDVEALLIRSASYYLKKGMYQKAITLYQNFIRRFPHNLHSVEAYFQIGLSQYKEGDWNNALMSFDQAEQHNRRLINAGHKSNSYYASEAALYHGIITQEKNSRIELVQPESEMKKFLQEKTSLLKQGVEDYQRVMEYKSQKMFEAGCRIGMFYEEVATELAKQEPSGSDPIKNALLQNDYLNSASHILQNSFLPHKKVLELAASIDSLTAPQKEWINRARERLQSNLLQAGTYLYNGVGAMQKAPVPKEIEASPLLYYQYQVKLLETLEPAKKKVLEYFNNLLDSLKVMHLDDSLTIITEINISRLYYLIGSAYDKMAIEILNSTNNLPKSLSETEREDLLFQLEDIVYELQDKALLRLEDAKEAMLRLKLEKNEWYKKVVETLARLDPDTYGKSFFVTVTFTTDDTWFIRRDSVPGWKSSTPPDDSGWYAAVQYLTGNEAWEESAFISSDSGWTKGYFWKPIFLNGKPRNATISVSVQGKYRFFINGKLALNDTVGTSSTKVFDSLNNIQSLLEGGDNILSCEVIGDSMPAAIYVYLKTMVDSSKHFTSTIKTPHAIQSYQRAIDSSALITSSLAQSDSVDSIKAAETVKATDKIKGMNRREIVKATESYRERERKALAALRKERLAIQKLRIKKAYIEKQKASRLKRSQ